VHVEKSWVERQVSAVTVVKVIDGDTIRVRHIPNYPVSSVRKHTKYVGNLSENTISVRIYGVDCPETAKFGNPAMPFAKEATKYIQRRTKCNNTTKNKSDFETVGGVVRIKVLSKDQYGRIVGKVKVKREHGGGLGLFQTSDLSLDLLKKGLATIYTGGGAQYDGKKGLLDKTLKEAQKKKKGMWCKGTKNVQTPAQYKQSTKKRGTKG
jgi:endonuclease YncB( thermonuclease family)